MSLATMGIQILLSSLMTMMMVMVIMARAGDNNPIFDPCSDTKVQRSDGFTFGLAFSSKDSFFFNQTQLSPCDTRLSLSSAELAVFRPKVDEISLLTINSAFNSVCSLIFP
ncbi:uncharacterized protein Fot_46225 [Forsythia ovata]|uniref:Uncharacterized protein n=1 Tax=Forsythia ovata TaxID=205694 RepID=A0ABD1QMH2_9LAMI